MADEDHLWDLWADALIEWELDSGVEYIRGPGAVVLRVGVPIFVITAYNPGGIPRDDAVNEAAQRELEVTVQRMGLLCDRATGRSPDGSWSEPGAAVFPISRDQACELGRRYGQLGVFELTETEMHVVRCRDGAIVRTRPR
jgi:hypothetical protein